MTKQEINMMTYKQTKKEQELTQKAQEKFNDEANRLLQECIAGIEFISREYGFTVDGYEWIKKNKEQ